MARTTHTLKDQNKSKCTQSRDSNQQGYRSLWPSATAHWHCDVESSLLWASRWNRRYRSHTPDWPHPPRSLNPLPIPLPPAPVPLPHPCTPPHRPTASLLPLLLFLLLLL